MKKNVLGAVIKAARKSKKITQKELSELTGYSQNTISNHENGNRSLGEKEIQIYSSALNISPDELFEALEIKQSIEQEEPENKPLSSIERIPIPTETKTLPLYGDVAAGALAEIEGLKVWDVETIDIPTTMLGRYAHDEHLFAMNVNGDSMNKVIPNGAIIVAKTLEDYMYKDGDIVIFNYDAEYSLKTYRPNMIDGFVVFEPKSDNAGFKNIAIDHTTLHEANMVSISGKVIFYSTTL
ncbi:MAG: LexA family protein [Brochothrix thermosphacta]|uniref:LexA family protein n=1 Tax=Brochothrix thermosphacta TaxID=2756 RepID=UPI003F9115E8